MALIPVKNILKHLVTSLINSLDLKTAKLLIENIKN